MQQQRRHLIHCLVAAALLLRPPASCPLADDSNPAYLLSAGSLKQPWEQHLDSFFGGSNEHAQPWTAEGNLELMPGLPGSLAPSAQVGSAAALRGGSPPAPCPCLCYSPSCRPTACHARTPRRPFLHAVGAAAICV
jgi:hypothetical protein